jgi:hypothetical protein
MSAVSSVPEVRVERDDVRNVLEHAALYRNTYGAVRTALAIGTCSPVVTLSTRFIPAGWPVTGACAPRIAR